MITGGNFPTTVTSFHSKKQFLHITCILSLSPSSFLFVSFFPQLPIYLLVRFDVVDFHLYTIIKTRTLRKGGSQRIKTAEMNIFVTVRKSIRNLQMIQKIQIYKEGWSLVQNGFGAWLLTKISPSSIHEQHHIITVRLCELPDRLSLCQ